jgi:hypothetical protein
MWKQILQYLYLRKPKPGAVRNVNVRLMHGMNRIAILIFLIAIVIMAIRLIKG